ISTIRRTAVGPGHPDAHLDARREPQSENLSCRRVRLRFSHSYSDHRWTHIFELIDAWLTALAFCHCRAEITNGRCGGLRPACTTTKPAARIQESQQFHRPTQR